MTAADAFEAREFAYADKIAPPFYRCVECGASQCKLWRPAHDSSPLRCIGCVEARESKRLGDQIALSLSGGDQIGGLLPAVPCENGRDWWGYTSVPPDGCAWWKALPTRPDMRREIRDAEVRGRTAGLTKAAEIAARLNRDFAESESCNGNLNRTRESRGANCVWTAIQAELDKETP